MIKIGEVGLSVVVVLGLMGAGRLESDQEIN